MKKMKLFLVLGLLMTALTAKSANEVYFALNETTGEATYYYDGNRASRTGLTTQVFTPGTAPFTGVKDKVKKIVIDASMQNHNLTSLSYMFSAGEFSELAQLASITGLNNLSTANVTNMSYMFHKCTKLTTIALSSFNTEKVTNMTYMFAFCSQLTSLDLSSFNTEKVTNMRHMFYYCYELTSIKGLDKFNTTNVSFMDNMFTSCKKLTALNLSSFNTEKVTNMSYMFAGCNALKSITGLDKFNTAKVTDMKFMFSGCYVLKSIPGLDKFDTSNVTSMEQMFGFCGSLTYLDLSMFKFGKVANTINMFKNDSSITVIYCTDDLSASATLTTSSGMFYYCKSLIGGEGTAYNSSYTDKTYACLDQGTSKKGYFTKPVYASFDKSKGQLNYCYDAFRKLNENPTYLYDPSNGSVNPLLNIATNNMEDVSLITKIVIEESMKDAKLKSTSMMFGIIFATNNISTIEGLTNLNTANVSDMSMMFDGCKVTSLDLSSFNTEKVTTMQSLFGDCVNLTTIIGLEKFNTAKVTNMTSMFFGCKALTSLDLNSFNINKVTDMNYMFKNCTNLETIYCNTVWSNSTASSDQFFRGCTKLKGGQGTEYATGKDGIEYARQDGGTSAPGYFTHSDPTAIENVNIETVRSEKFIENGQLYIMHNGTKYNIQGATVK